MKIFLLIPDDYASGGIQRSALAARECLIEGGHGVTILCVKTLPGGFAEDFDFVRSVSAQIKARSIFWIRFIYELRRLLIFEKVDILVGLGLSPSVFGRVASLGLTRLSCIGSERAYPPATPLSPVWKVLRRLSFPLLDAIVSQTARTAEWYRNSLSIPRERLVVIGNVIAPPLGGPLPPLSVLDKLKGRRVIACVGRFQPQKGLDMALEIFAQVVESCPTARLLMIGEGPLQNDLSKLVDTLGISESVFFHPPIGHLGQIWQAVEIFLLTSRYEGIPNVLIEAMAHGRACVSFDCQTGPAEMIVDGVNGFLVPLGDCALASRRCKEILTNPDLKNRLGLQAAKIPERFSANEIGFEWNELVRRVQSAKSRN